MISSGNNGEAYFPLTYWRLCWLSRPRLTGLFSEVPPTVGQGATSTLSLPRPMAIDSGLKSDRLPGCHHLQKSVRPDDWFKGQESWGSLRAGNDNVILFGPFFVLNTSHTSLFNPLNNPLWYERKVRLQSHSRVEWIQTQACLTLKTR